MRAHHHVVSLARALVALAAVAALASSACKRHGRDGTGSGAAGAVTSSDRALVPVPMNATAPTAPSPAAPAASVDPLSAPERAAYEGAKASLASLQTAVARGTLSDPKHPDDADARMRCDGFASSRPTLAPRPEEAVQKVVADLDRLCSLEVPLIGAGEALARLNLSPSQASRRLMCGVASQDLERARAARATDPRVRDLDTRWKRTCR